MKRLLLAPVLLSVLSGCVNPLEINRLINKDNIINLKCTLNQRKGDTNKFELIKKRHLFQIFHITIDKKNKTGFYNKTIGINKLKMSTRELENLLLSSDSIEFRHYWYIESKEVPAYKYKFFIDRTNGEIIYSIWDELFQKASTYKGICHVPEDLETLF